MKSTTRYVCVAIAAIALVGCQNGDEPSAQGSTTTSVVPASGTSTSTTTTPACTLGPTYSPGTTTHRLSVAGVDREFLVRVPPRPTAAMPLVVDFHGAGSNMQEQSLYTEFDPLADDEGFVVATPNGIDAAVRQWRFLGTQDDVEFAKAVVAELVANTCVDDDRVFAVGMSSGSAMSASLACQAADVFRGFGLVAANFYLPPLCDAAPPRPMIIFHGTDDAVVPYAGGPVATGSGIQVASTEENAQRWAEHNGCAPEPREVVLDTEVVRIDWAGCDEPVVLYRIVGGGHTWPDGAVDVGRLGHTTRQINATEEMWELFSMDR
jgi:polyhydroxybutyrate depolymerase